jgi:hypothetical protein
MIERINLPNILQRLLCIIRHNQIKIEYNNWYLERLIAIKSKYLLLMYIIE